MILKDLLKDNKEVVIILNENNRKQFLRQAKEEGFKWIGDKDIQENDECSFRMIINENYFIANISTMTYLKSKDLQALATYHY